MASVEDAVKIGRLIRKGLIDTEAPDGLYAPLYISPATGLLEKRLGWGSLTSYPGVEVPLFVRATIVIARAPAF